MEQCPTCQARLKEALVCPRCRTEIALLQQIDESVEYLQYQALIALAQDDLQGAIQAIEQALQLKAQPFLMVLRDFVRYRAREKRQQRLLGCVERFLAEDELLHR